jgi:hypothetical protein
MRSKKSDHAVLSSQNVADKAQQMFLPSLKSPVVLIRFDHFARIVNMDHSIR